MSGPLRESITHLDWVLSCGMAANGVECAAKATHWTERHLVSACTHPVANADGNIERFVCSAHLAVLEREAARVARHYNPTGLRAWWTFRPPFCPTCGRPLQHAGDILQTVERLEH